MTVRLDIKRFRWSLGAAKVYTGRKLRGVWGVVPSFHGKLERRFFCYIQVQSKFTLKLDTLCFVHCSAAYVNRVFTVSCHIIESITGLRGCTPQNLPSFHIGFFFHKSNSDPLGFKFLVWI